MWVFLSFYDVEPTNNRAERALRFGVLWRKRSLGTASDKGNRWVERILSLKETCRLQARSIYEVLVDAVSSLFTNQPPALGWIGHHRTSTDAVGALDTREECSRPSRGHRWAHVPRLLPRAATPLPLCFPICGRMPA